MGSAHTHCITTVGPNTENEELWTGLYKGSFNPSPSHNRMPLMKILGDSYIVCQS